jgi:hypothetical protein
MQYDIKLSGTPFDDGAIDLDRLELLAQYLHDIAKGALQMRMFGTSARRGKDTAQITNALKIRLRGLSQGSTVLHLECEPFRKTLQSVQGNLFHQEILRRLPDQTPMSLIIESFQDALNPESNGEMLDKKLLKDLQGFKKVFLNEAHTMQLSNRGSMPDVELRLRDFSRLKQIEDTIPKPQLVMVSGRVEELKFSKAKVTFIPDKGRPFTGFLGEDVAPAEMAKFWGQKATIRGTAHFKPNGTMAYVEIAKVSLATETDAYFSRTPRRETAAQQIERQLQEGKGRGSTLKRLVDAFADETWETSLEEDLQMLQE